MTENCRIKFYQIYVNVSLRKIWEVDMLTMGHLSPWMSIYLALEMPDINDIYVTDTSARQSDVSSLAVLKGGKGNIPVHRIYNRKRHWCYICKPSL